MGTVWICLFTYFLCFTFGSLTGLSITTDNKDYDDECTLPALPEHGHYSVAGEDKDPVPGGSVGDETILLFACEPGYTPNGATTAICVQGSWITDFKQCHKSNTCIFPEIPINGSYKVTPQTNSVVFGTELPNWTLITFSCDPLFDLVGSRITLCRDGIWSKNSPQCKRNKRCHIPELLKNGKYTIVGSDSFPLAGAVVQEKTAMYFKCDSGFNLIGGSVSMCQEALWLGGIPTCEEIKDCELPTPPEYGSFSLLGSSGNALLQCNAQEKHTIAFTCEPGYELAGREWSTCLDGNWTSDVPKCIAIKSCILPIKPTNGYYRTLGLSENATAGEKVAESTVLLFSCDNHFNLLGSRVVFCENGSWSGSIPHCERYEECSNVQNQVSGVYIIQPPASPAPFQAYCDLSLVGEKWTVIQSRSNNHLSFFRNYKNYTDGFGSISDDHWLGLAHIHELTKDDNHELYVELEHMDGKMYYARYSQFKVGDEKSGFKLTIGGYIGTAGDSLVYHNGMKFSTPERDQDEWGNNCAVEYKGGWWFKSCHYSNLNGFLYTTVVDKPDGVSWYYMSNKWLSFKKSRMLVKKKL